MKKGIKFVCVALFSTIMLVFHLWVYAVCEEDKSTRPSATDIPSIVELPDESQIATLQPATEQPALSLPVTEEPATVPPTTDQTVVAWSAAEQLATVQPTAAQPVEEELAAVDSLSTSSIGLNLYEQQSTNAPILYVFETVDRVVVLDQNNKWIHVDFNGRQGYIATFEPAVAQEPVPTEEPAIQEELTAEDSAQEQEAPENQEPELTAEPASDGNSGSDQEPKITIAPSSLDFSVKPDAVPADLSVKISADAHGALHYGDVITLTADLSGAEGLAYTLQWQQRDQGGSWRDIEGENELQYSFTLNNQNEHSEWRLGVGIK